MRLAWYRMLATGCTLAVILLVQLGATGVQGQDGSSSAYQAAADGLMADQSSDGLSFLDLPRPMASASTPWVMAYRGASAAWPEHSVGAYKAAIEQGGEV